MSDCTCPQVCLEHSRTLEEARALLERFDGRVHTFRDGGLALIGADWDLADVETCIAEYGVALSGEAATGMRHGLVSIDDRGPVFFATKAST